MVGTETSGHITFLPYLLRYEYTIIFSIAMHIYHTTMIWYFTGMFASIYIKGKEFACTIELNA